MSDLQQHAPWVSRKAQADVGYRDRNRGDQAPARARIQPQEPRRFLCDAMLGSLCRWLRFSGFDAEYAGVVESDLVIARRAESSGRWLLTRDRELAAAGPRTVLVRSVSLDDQLVEVCLRLGLRLDSSFRGARCGECNGVLRNVSKEEISDVVPPYVLRTADRFRRCVTCKRVYWPGTHSARIAERLARVAALVSSP